MVARGSSWEVNNTKNGQLRSDMKEWFLGNVIVVYDVLQDLTRLPSQTTSSRWQVDKEATGLPRAQHFYHLCIARPYQKIM